VNDDSTYLLTVGENKTLSVWRLPLLELVNERSVNSCVLVYQSENWFPLVPGSYQKDQQDWPSQKIHKPLSFLINLATCSGMGVILILASNWSHINHTATHLIMFLLPQNPLATNSRRTKTLPMDSLSWDMHHPSTDSSSHKTRNTLLLPIEMSTSE
jgi:hypothetical protein